MSRLSITSTSPSTVTIDGEELLAFQGCDYLGLAHHPEVLEAAGRALYQGISVSASRETTGHRPIYDQLEEALAEFLGVEAALVTSSGYLADLALLQGLSGPERVAIADADAHPALLDAARAAGLSIQDHGPGDLTRAHALLDRSCDRGPLLLTDGVYPLQGRLSQLPDLLQILPGDGHLVVDDSHGVGVIGPGTRGSCAYWSVQDPRVVITTSLAKGLGAFGGAVAGSASVIARIRSSAESYLGSTPPPPHLAAAALAAIDVLGRERSRQERLQANCVALQRIGVRLGLEEKHPPLPVLALPVADELDGKRVQLGLRAKGIFVAHIHYPGAPSAGVLRLAVNAEHGAADLRRLEEALAPLYPEQDA